MGWGKLLVMVYNMSLINVKPVYDGHDINGACLDVGLLCYVQPTQPPVSALIPLYLAQLELKLMGFH